MTPIGVDEWVARSGERAALAPGWRGRALRLTSRMGWWPWLVAAGLLGALFPTIAANVYQLQVGLNAVILALLALGLNITVGWTGILDLGYVAFYGFGAYVFSLLSSDQLSTAGIHLPAIASFPIVMVAAALLGLLVGWPSRRLSGDYLAIVTLFFGEAFFEFTNNVAPSKLGGPNGIPSVDPIHGFGGQILTAQGYYYFALIALVVTMGVLHLLDKQRIGRAWKAVREDSLAAELMTVPINKVKLMAFSFGAVVAAVAGAIFAADQAGVYPTDFNTQVLILIYAGLILGGAGSIAGAVVGGLLVSVLLELLRTPTDAGYVFYGVILITLVARLRPWRLLGAVLAGTVAFGFAAYNIAKAISPTAVAGGPGSTGFVGKALKHWVIVPANPTTYGNVLFVVLVVALIALVQVKGWKRYVLLVPTLYVAACCWEARLVQEPSITRQILIGTILIVMMIARPQGLLGTRRVEVV